MADIRVFHGMHRIPLRLWVGIAALGGNAILPTIIACVKYCIVRAGARGFDYYKLLINVNNNNVNEEYRDTSPWVKKNTLTQYTLAR